MALRSVLLFLLFQATWFAAVLGAARREALWGPAAALALVVVHLALLPGGAGARAVPALFRLRERISGKS